MYNKPIRNLKCDEIECKIATIKSGKGLSLMLYKTARTDTLILNETFGMMNWQSDYKEIKGNLYCGVSVYNDLTGSWVTKWDCGTVSQYGDKEKGEASDAFKRACFKWGIGIELYTSPFIWVPADKCNIQISQGKEKCFDTFSVTEIKYNSKEIIKLEIKNNTKNCRAFAVAKNIK